jgi:hypothetical protein
VSVLKQTSEKYINDYKSAHDRAQRRQNHFDFRVPLLMLAQTDRLKTARAQIADKSFLRLRKGRRRIKPRGHIQFVHLVFPRARFDPVECPDPLIDPADLALYPLYPGRYEIPLPEHTATCS